MQAIDLSKDQKDRFRMRDSRICELMQVMLYVAVYRWLSLADAVPDVLIVYTVGKSGQRKTRSRRESERAGNTNR
jgi:hypothetical protein